MSLKISFKIATENLFIEQGQSMILSYFCYLHKSYFIFCKATHVFLVIGQFQQGPDGACWVVSF